MIFPVVTDNSCAILQYFPHAQNFPRKNFPWHGFFTRGARMKTLCFQRLVFGLLRANSKNRRREDAPRIPLGD